MVSARCETPLQDDDHIFVEAEVPSVNRFSSVERSRSGRFTRRSGEVLRFSRHELARGSHAKQDPRDPRNERQRTSLGIES
jgi:hypothetical protein